MESNAISFLIMIVFKNFYEILNPFENGCGGKGSEVVHRRLVPLYVQVYILELFWPIAMAIYIYEHSMCRYISFND